ncbi:hypothetical protein [Pseudomonas chlororaphis]|uniref:hypothetical protein n=1 Tax=Pseudomonas chlororaphis TaxID=587753 RepID=UPI002366A02A|nr:hypothetical protein [Pseudomonas chlororaphis]WDG53255.1 hypothetical protein PUP76_25855 [Pseudomonas chlororaphis]WDH85723.1 hypothetical protein PUP74_16325 [Pseudomonas chlororaphis]
MPVYAAFENGVAVKKSTEGRLGVADRAGAVRTHSIPSIIGCLGREKLNVVNRPSQTAPSLEKRHNRIDMAMPYPIHSEYR